MRNKKNKPLLYCEVWDSIHYDTMFKSIKNKGPYVLYIPQNNSLLKVYVVVLKEGQ